MHEYINYAIVNNSSFIAVLSTPWLHVTRVFSLAVVLVSADLLLDWFDENHYSLVDNHQ